MKQYSIFIMMALTFLRCSYYKEATQVPMYKLEDVEKLLEKVHYTTTSVNKISKKLLATFRRDGTTFTTDTILFNKRDVNNLLLRYGKSNDANSGYFIVKSNDRIPIESRVIVYSFVTTNSIKTSYYRIKEKVVDWDSIKGYVKWENYILRIGGKTK